MQPSYGSFFDSLIMKESSGDNNAIGDKKLADHAYGCLQVRKPCLIDVNKRFGTRYQPQDMLGNRSLSVWVCQKYLEMYATRTVLGREPTDEDRARIWNGGPLGAFDGGAINKYGTLMKDPVKRQKLARQQANAKRYAADVMKKIGKK